MLRGACSAARTAAKVDATLEAQAMMGSFLRMREADRTMDEKLDAMEAELGLSPLRRPCGSPVLPPIGAGIDLPITVGRRR